MPKRKSVNVKACPLRHSGVSVTLLFSFLESSTTKMFSGDRIKLLERFVNNEVFVTEVYNNMFNQKQPSKFEINQNFNETENKRLDSGSKNSVFSSNNFSTKSFRPFKSS